MMLDNTNLATGAQLVAETLELDYGIDPAEVFAVAELDMSRLKVPGARYPWPNLRTLWEEATQRSGDPCFGLAVGARVRIGVYHAIGFSWVSSATLLEALQRLVRYRRVLSTVEIDVGLEPTPNDEWCLSIRFPDPSLAAGRANTDGFARGMVGLMQAATRPEFFPAAVHLPHDDAGQAARYREALGPGVRFDQECCRVVLARADAEATLPGNNPELASANDMVAERYLASLDPSRVATEVRELLVEMMPSGTVRQEDVAQRMNRSLSTLQRQLTSEGLNFQHLRDETRRRLAEDYIRSNELSLSQIAYLLGFSDQSNFSRAFKRWTGMSPREYRG
ncbi:MAG: AraC family transcriptional regulator [Chromatiales bacterium]|nr:MAG: AraC family transcriptional regulator [Chromatiales bacterium]